MCLRVNISLVNYSYMRLKTLIKEMNNFGQTDTFVFKNK